MIPAAEIRRAAATQRIDPMVVDLDYVQGCFLATLYRQQESAALVFKGGTCLKKCYYADYRFSRDLDFTLTRRLSKDALVKLLDAVLAASADEWEIELGARPVQVDVVSDDYGKESYQVRLYYRGPWTWRKGPRAIRLDVTASEVLAFPTVERTILQPYSDAARLAEVRVPCYDLLEMVTEKVRALAGQRTHAISRDIYDIAQLVDRHNVDMARLAAAIPGKWKVKGLPMGPFDLGRLSERREEFRGDWERNLVDLLPADKIADFDTTWDRTQSFLCALNQKWQGASES
jgi:predicted nucleotidyltransferase component of viral defense system